MRIAKLIEDIRTGAVDVVEHTKETIERCKEINDEYGYFNEISEKSAVKQAVQIRDEIKNGKARGKKLLGVAISAKDSICVKGVKTTAGSRILENYMPLFDAFVIEKIKSEGGIIIGKTSQDEFGFGTFSSTSAYSVPKNPFDKNRSCGGSSGGSAGICQKLDSHISLGESTGGSIVTPASFCGVYGLCPTYGRVSRHGLIDYANSLDKIGPMGTSVEDVALLMTIIAGHDGNDSTSLNYSSEDYTRYVNIPIKKMKIGIIKESFATGIEKEVEKKVHSGINAFADSGALVEEVSLELPIKYGIETYYTIAVSEASTNLAKYCGMRYGAALDLHGNFNEYFSDVRSAKMGDEAKRRIILGTFARMSGYRDAFYLKAMKVRTLIINEYKKIFGRFDALVSPTVPILPPRFLDIEKLTPLQNYMMDIMTVSPNLAGLPHMNIPVGFEKCLPVGMMLTADHLQEGNLIRLASAIEGKSKWNSNLTS